MKKLSWDDGFLSGLGCSITILKNAGHKDAVKLMRKIARNFRRDGTTGPQRPFCVDCGEPDGSKFYAGQKNRCKSCERARRRGAKP